MNMFKKFPDYWSQNSLMEVYIGMEQAESLIA